MKSFFLVVCDGRYSVSQPTLLPTNGCWEPNHICGCVGDQAFLFIYHFFLFCLYMWGYDRRLLVKLWRYSSRNVTANLSLVIHGTEFFSSRPPLSLTEKIIFLIPFSFCVVFFKRIFSTLVHSCLRRNIRRAHEVNNTNFGRFPWPEVAWTWLTITWPILLTQNTLASWKSSFRNVFPRWRYSSPVFGL